MNNYFTLGEFCHSTTAVKYGIPNTPNAEETKNCYQTIALLNKIRQAWTDYCSAMGWGSGAIQISSGFRSAALNSHPEVKGSPTSAHVFGLAADIKPVNGQMKEFQEFIPKFLLDNKIMFDQFIIEKPIKGVASWIHIGLKNQQGLQRMQIKTIS